MRATSLISTRPAVYCALLLSLALGACATAGKSASAKPIFYPNAAFERLGTQAANQAVATCVSSAQAQGIGANNGALSSNAGKGAATTGVMAAVGALVTGRNVDAAIKAGAQGAVAGAAGGMVNGAYEDQYNPVYRKYVESCLAEKGLQVMGWN